MSMLDALSSGLAWCCFRLLPTGGQHLSSASLLEFAERRLTRYRAVRKAFHICCLRCVLLRGAMSVRGLVALRGLSRRAVSAPGPVRGGGGGPVPSGRVAQEALPEQDEWIWDDGTWNPEPCMDVNTTATTNGALGMLAAGLGGFFGLYKICQYHDKASYNPVVPRQFPYDNLAAELGGDNGVETCVKHH